MARDSGGSLGDVAKATCPLQCRLRYGLAADSSLGEQVDWAGLPINLDLAFSQQQRDKVYAQHLTRKRGTQLHRRSPDSAKVCACEYAADAGRDHPDEAGSLPGR